MRILVKGASTVVAMSELGLSRDNFTYPRAMEQRLFEAGQPAIVYTHGVASEQTKTVLKTWQHEIHAWSPDVILLCYGHYETIHFFLPRWLERHANSLKARRGPVQDFYRRKVLRKVWVSLAKLQVKLDTRYDSTWRRNRPKRVAQDLRTLIDHALTISRPLIILVDLLPPGPRGQSWFPGMTERLHVMNASIAQMVADVDDPNVRVFHVADVVDRVVPAGENPLPDGFHYSAPLHREIGRTLADEILEWAEKQPHLQPPA
jgi:hypothetical protein